MKPAKCNFSSFLFLFGEHREIRVTAHEVYYGLFTHTCAHTHIAWAERKCVLSSGIKITALNGLF